MIKTPEHWIKRIREGGKPAYILLPELIAEDIHKGLYGVRDPLPTLRDLARDLGLNYTTVARGYAEARKRGLIDSHVGVGTVVRGSHPGLPIRSGTGAAMTLNSPPEPDQRELLERLKREAADLFLSVPGSGLYDLLRYQDFGGTDRDREAGRQWLQSHLPGCDVSQILVTPGIHGVLLAAMTMLVQAGQTICVESLGYPGIKAISAQLGIKLQALPMDDQGIDPNAFEHVCRTVRPRMLICNPTIQNPTAATMGRQRREAITDVALRYSIPIVEDDAYGKLADDDLPTLASLAPELTYYVSGLSKSLGAGLRIAYVHAPSQRQVQRLAGALRATTVMASPVTAALSTRWITSGCAYQLLDAVRGESIVRQAIATRCLDQVEYQAHPSGFHLWVRTGARRTPVELALALRAQGVPCVASMAFATDADPEPAMRICLGGNLSRSEVEKGLHLVAMMLEPSAHFDSHV